MKYIHFVIVGLCIVLSAFVTPAYGVEVNAMIHYSEKFVDIQSEFALEQGYSIKVIDANPTNGDSLVEIYLNGKKVDSDMQFAKENKPFEYIKTVTDDDDSDNDNDDNNNDDNDNDGKETDYLIIRIIPLGITEEPFSVKFKTEQFLDSQLDAAEYLILDKPRSIKVGTPLELEEGYTLEVSDIDDSSVTLILNKNGYLVKEEEVEKGDIFAYSKMVNGRFITIFIAKLDEFFVGADSEVVFLKQVSQRADIFVESGATITVESAGSTKLRDRDIAIIRYTLESADISEVDIFLDDEKIDSRKSVDTGTYSTATGKLDTGIHEIMINVVAEDGTRSIHTKAFTVEPSIVSDAAGLAAEAASGVTSDLVGKIDKDDDTVGKVLEMPGFGSIVSTMVIGLVFIAMRARKI